MEDCENIKMFDIKQNVNPEFTVILPNELCKESTHIEKDLVYWQLQIVA